MHEYRMTYVVRILSAITLIPTGVFCIYAGIDAANRKLSTGTVVTSYGVGLAFLLATALVWAHCIKKQVVLNDRSISMTSLFGTKVINIERGTRITHDSVDSLGVKGTAFGGIVGGAVGGLATGLLEAAASTQGEAATKNIKITLTNEKARIELNSNITQ